MADFSQAAPSLEACVSRPGSHVEILAESFARLVKDDEDQRPQKLSASGHRLVVDTELDKIIEENQRQQSPCGTSGHGKLTLTQGEEKQECGIGLTMIEDGDGAENIFSQKSFERAMEGQGKTYSNLFHDGDGVVNARVHVDVDACKSQMGKLSVLAGKEKTCEEGQAELFHTEKVMQIKAAHASNKKNGGISNLISEQRQEQGKTKQVGGSTPEELNFTIEDSSWPTLAEACHAKSTRSRSSQVHPLQVSNKEVASISLPAQKVASSQENVQERLLETKHINTITRTPGPKFKPLSKKGGYGKSSFLFTENLPLPPMGGHVPSANMSIPNHLVKGNGLVGINKYLAGSHQALAHGPFYHNGAGGLAPFPHDAAVPPTYGRGHAWWQHYGRGYGDANYKHTGFMPPPYDQQRLGLRHTCPPIPPFMSMNVAHYNYQSYQGDTPYMPGTPSPGFNYATPYFRPPGPIGVMAQAPSADIPMVHEMLQKQIDYYFSAENLCHDTFLTSKMDDEGFVPLSLIASFPRVRSLTFDTTMISEAMRNSVLVEVKNGKLRSHDWRRWKHLSSNTSGMQGIERSNLSASRRCTGSENAVEEENGKFNELQDGHLDNMRSLSETRMITSLCAAPWAGISANAGTVSMPKVITIDSR